MVSALPFCRHLTETHPRPPTRASPYRSAGSEQPPHPQGACQVGRAVGVLVVMWWVLELLRCLR